MAAIQDGQHYVKIEDWPKLSVVWFLLQVCMFDFEWQLPLVQLLDMAVFSSSPTSMFAWKFMWKRAKKSSQIWNNCAKPQSNRLGNSIESPPRSIWTIYQMSFATQNTVKTHQSEMVLFFNKLGLCVNKLRINYCYKFKLFMAPLFLAYNNSTQNENSNPGTIPTYCSILHRRRSPKSVAASVPLYFNCKEQPRIHRHYGFN